jgi:hypothetical protein
VAVDLTCGLGVDAYGLSRRFERVIAVERDPFLAAVARENFRRLGVRNVEVVCASAGEFLNSVAGPVDLVYVDPDRRGGSGGGNARCGGGKKLVRIEDCSPDVIALMPRIRAIAPRLMVKLSPLFDVAEVLRVFGPGTGVEVVSMGGECKEVVADVTFGPPADPATRAAATNAVVSAVPAAPSIRAVAIGLGEVEYPASSRGELPAGPFTPDDYRWLVIPDVALRKARLARRYFVERGVWIESDNGYGFSVAKPGDIMGRALAIESIEPFDPKTLKRRLKAQGVKNLDILKRDFPLSAADIARQSGIREGGSRKIAFTRAAGRLWQIVISPE